jgi:hypothetical protein
MPEIMMRGIYRDVLRDSLGQPVSDSGWRSNMIVMRCRVLLSAFMKGDKDSQTQQPVAFGIQSLKLGRGNASWDTTPPASPDPNTITSLVDQTPYSIPASELTLHYLDAGNQISQDPTNRLEVIATLGPNEPPPDQFPPPYPLREFGLFGVLNGTDYMIDYIRHPLIEKDSAVTLERRVQLIF